MLRITFSNGSTRQLGVALLASALMLAGGCAQDDGDGGAQAPMLSLDMALPDTLTGGRSSAGAGSARVAPQATGEPCAYLGPEDDDNPLRNGHEMTKFMVSAIATWTCIADTLIEIAGFIPHDGVIYETDNDVGAANYDADDPTHYSVSDDSATQTTIRLYYGFARENPPTGPADAAFYISWHEEANGDVRGRVVINASAFDDLHAADEPTDMRLDFTYTDSQQFADMFLRFDDGNPWAEGFRIEVTRDLVANPLARVFTARGLIAMKAQFAPVPGISELPDIKMYTVSDRFGDGAAIALVTDLSLPLELNTGSGNHLGNYLFDKTDIYFFDGDQAAGEPWDWIDKQITAAAYRGNRTTPASGGTLIPFDPSLDLIIAELGLDADYFSGTKCANVNDDCSALLAAIFADGFADQEPNQGADPMDWRSTAIAGADYLASVYPNGINWDGAFDMAFTP